MSCFQASKFSFSWLLHCHTSCWRKLAPSKSLTFNTDEIITPLDIHLISSGVYVLPHSFLQIYTVRFCCNLFWICLWFHCVRVIWAKIWIDWVKLKLVIGDWWVVVTDSWWIWGENWVTDRLEKKFDPISICIVNLWSISFVDWFVAGDRNIGVVSVNEMEMCVLWGWKDKSSLNFWEECVF